MDDESALEFVEQYFGNGSRLTEIYTRLQHPAMKSDILRYLLLFVYGGIYSDLDTAILRPIAEWIPMELQDHVRLLIGIEYDRRTDSAYPGMAYWVQFCQWTIAATPGHTILRDMIAHSLESIEDLAKTYGRSIEELDPTDDEVARATGPVGWTEVCFNHMQKVDPSLQFLEDLSLMGELRLVGDVLVLGINSFGMGQPHSGSQRDGTPPHQALVRHLFHGSWKKDWMG